MPVVIDGHNLIGEIPEISLADPEDEMALIRYLRERDPTPSGKMVVFFDRAAPGSRNHQLVEGIKVHFVRPPLTADEAIVDFLEGLQGEAANWTVVSSDLGVKGKAGALGSRVLSCPEYLDRLSSAGKDVAGGLEKPEKGLSEEEIRRWERLFREGKG